MQDELERWRQAWLSQSVDLPEQGLIERKWRTTRRNQRYFLALDLLGLVALAVFVWSFETLHWFERVWLVAMLLLALFTTVLNIRLRWPSLTVSSDSTQAHIHQLAAQCRNNLVLVSLTRLSLVLLMSGFLLFFVGSWYFDLVVARDGWSRFGLMLAVLLIIVLPWWAWTARQKRANKRELQWLLRLLNP